MTNTAPISEPTVLIVEDDVLVRAVAVESLRDSGLRVLCAGDVERALAILREHASIELVVTDVKLPGGRSGIDLVRLLLKAVQLNPKVQKNHEP